MEKRKFKYDFFISYKHGDYDSKISGYIQKKLENYKIPKEIQKRSGKTKITKVFRDKEELSVTVDLSQEIEEQLKNTEYLIVMCSPASKKSRWVNQEVQTFIKYRGWEYVLPVLIEGEPCDAFPDILNEREMLAADMRGKNFNEAKKKCNQEILRLIAPALGCSYDELRQRNKLYAARRMAAAALILSVTALGFGAYAWHQSVKIQENYWQKMKNQAGLLAEKSNELLEKGDREGALLVALEALPDTLNKEEKPLVGKAQMALENALYLYEQPSMTAPRATKILKMDEDASGNFALNEEKTILISSDTNNQIYFWNLTDGTLMHKFDGLSRNNEECEDVFAGDDNLAYICTNEAVYCYDYEKKEVMWQIQAEEYAYWYNYEIAPSRETLAFTHQEYLTLIDLKEGIIKKEYLIEGEDPSISKIVWNPNEKQLGLCSIGFSSKGWLGTIDLENGEQMLIKVFEEWIDIYISFRDDNLIDCLWYESKTFLDYIYSQENYYVAEYNCHTGEELWEIENQTVLRYTTPQIGYINEVSEGKTLDLVTVSVGSEVIGISEGMVWAEFSYDSAIVNRRNYGLTEVHTTENGQNYRIHWGTRNAFNEFYSTLKLGIEDIIMSEEVVNNSLIACPRYGGGSIYVYEISKDDEYTEVTNSEESLYYSFSPERKYRIGKGHINDDAYDYALNIWNLESGEHLFRKEFLYDSENRTGERLEEIGFLDEQYYYYSTKEQVVICDINTFETMAAFVYQDFFPDSYSSIDKVYPVEGTAKGLIFNDNDYNVFFLSSNENKTSLIMSSEEAKEIIDQQYGEEAYGFHFTVNPTGEYLFFCASQSSQETSESKILIWDVRNQCLCGQFKMPYDNYEDFNLAFSSDGNQMMFQNLKNGLQIMNLTDGTIEKLPFDGVNYQKFMFSENDRYLLIYSYDYFLTVYDRENQCITMNEECDAVMVDDWYCEVEEVRIVAKRSMSQPFVFSFRKIGEGLYECYSRVVNCEIITHGRAYVRPNSSHEIYNYPHRNLEEMILMARDLLNGRELTDVERQRYSIDN